MVSGIAKLNQDMKSRRVINGSNEIILSDDGDSVVGAIASTGHDDDGLVATFYRHAYKGDDGSWKFTLCPKRTFQTACRLCSTGEGGRPQHRFAFWMWVNSLFKFSVPTNGMTDGWNPVTVDKGQTMFEREIRDFRIMQLPIGKGEMYWEMFVEMFEVFNSLDSVFMKVSRKGKELNTVWDITETPRINPRKVDWNDLDSDNKRSQLIPILDYYGEVDKSNEMDSEEEKNSERSRVSALVNNSTDDEDDDSSPMINDLF